jgi:hypothetical protein
MIYMYKPKDYVQQLADHIEKNLKKGYTVDSIRVSLSNQGYSRISIENAIERANEQLAKKIPPIIEKPEINYKVISDEAVPKKKSFSGFFKRIFRG